MSPSNNKLAQVSFFDAPGRAPSYALFYQLLAVSQTRQRSVLLSIIVSLSTTVIGQASFLNVSFRRFFLYTTSSITCHF